MLSLAEAQKAYDQAYNYLNETQGVESYLYRELEKAKRRLNRAIIIFKIIKSILPSENWLYSIAADNIEEKIGILNHLQKQIPLVISESEKAFGNLMNANFDLLNAQSTNIE